MARRGANLGTIVIKRIEEGEEAHHGGAWKVAYADFVTAMMAFFLLMWLLNATTEEQRRGLADYFSPSNVMGRNVSGSGEPFGGRTPNEDGTFASDLGAFRIEQGPQPVNPDVQDDDSEVRVRPVLQRDAPPGPEEQAPSNAPTRPDGTGNSVAQDRAAGAGGRDDAVAAFAPDDAAANAAAQRLSDQALRNELARREQAAFDRTAAQLRATLREDPKLAELAKQLLVEQTPEGLRIQVLDSDRQPMFALGGTALNERARALLGRVAAAVAPLPNAIAISGHTDSTVFRGTDRSNWELSADRANATRRLLAESGIGEGRLRSVTGQADREPLLPAQPEAAANRRISILLLRQAADGVAVPETMRPAAAAAPSPPAGRPANQERAAR